MSFELEMINYQSRVIEMAQELILISEVSFELEMINYQSRVIEMAQELILITDIDK